MREKLNAYFEKEYQVTVDFLENPPKWGRTEEKKRDMIHRSVNRCLGAAMFAQELGLPYEDIEAYNDFLARFRKLLLDI